MQTYGIITAGASAQDELDLWAQRLSRWQNSQCTDPVQFTTDMLIAQRALCLSLSTSGRYLVRYYNTKRRSLKTELVYAIGPHEAWQHIKEHYPDAQLIGVMGHKLQGAL